LSARIERLIGFATLQGLPLTGYRRFGVPPGGAFDQESHALANALLDNPAAALTIELSNAQIDMVFSAPTRLAVVGAPADYANSALSVASGGSIRIGATRTGLRIYVAVSGGWIPDGIESDLARSGRRLTAGEVLEHKESLAAGELRLARAPGSLSLEPIRVLAGPQPLVELSGTFTVSNQSDRTGVRLDGLPATTFEELTSEPACVGAIQVTPSGQLIVIGPDGPTIGGYPKAAVVCSADLDRLAHLRPGQEVCFETVDFRTAQNLMRERESRITRIVSQLAIAR
jgi:allophanate hydrolase subunit 2